MLVVEPARVVHPLLQADQAKLVKTVNASSRSCFCAMSVFLLLRRIFSMLSSSSRQRARCACTVARAQSDGARGGDQSASRPTSSSQHHNNASSHARGAPALRLILVLCALHRASSTAGSIRPSNEGKHSWAHCSRFWYSFLGVLAVQAC